MPKRDQPTERVTEDPIEPKVGSQNDRDPRTGSQPAQDTRDGDDRDGNRGQLRRDVAQGTPRRPTG